MNPSDAAAYLSRHFDTIDTALAAGDTTAALAVPERIAADGHRAVAEIVADGVSAALQAGDSR